MAEKMGVEVVGEIQLVRSNPTPAPTVKEELKVEETPEAEAKEDDKEGK
ncbi:MAG: hypothetical protein II335_00200 [Firmicutes bacterium]|nr:hypothetical protein [Bacillota bacterium]